MVSAQLHHPHYKLLSEGSRTNDPKLLDRINVVSLAMLASAATAWLPLETALYETLQSFLTIKSSLAG